MLKHQRAFTGSFFLCYLYQRVIMKNLFRQVVYKLTNLIKNIVAFKDIFKKSSDYNEKTVIGFLAFAVMTLAIIVDLITGWIGKPLVLNEYIFDAFMYIVLGSFLPDVIEKFAEMRNTKHNKSPDEETQENI